MASGTVKAVASKTEIVNSNTVETVNGVTCYIYENASQVIVCVDGTPTARGTELTVIDLSSRSDIPNYNIVQPLYNYAWDSKRGQVMLNEGAVKVTFTSTAYSNGQLIIPKV